MGDRQIDIGVDWEVPIPALAPEIRTIRRAVLRFL
jgi:hypothetical protein